MSDEAKPTPEFSFLVDVTALPPSGRTYKIKASDAERAAVAARLGLQKVDVLTASFELKPGAGGIVKVIGTAEAEVTQTCVVSLAPVPARINEAVEASFITEELAAAKEKKRKAKDDEEEELSLSGEDPPELAQEGRIDLGELAVVHVALALDPYPRAPGAAFDPAVWGLSEQNEENPPIAGPFAALAGLKKGPSKPS